MRLSPVVVAAVLLSTACGSRTDLDLLDLPESAPIAANDASIDLSIDASSDVTVHHAFDAAIDVTVEPLVGARSDTQGDVEVANEAAADAPEDATLEADVHDAEADVRDAGTDAAICAWGGLTPAVTYPEGPPTASHGTYLAVGDFNRDGHLDLVATDEGETASVYINQGDGTFAPQVTYPIGAWTNTVVTGDFDGDGWLDIAAANGLPGCGRTCCENTCDASLAVLINKGDGTFDAPAFYDSGGRFASGLAVGDMNGDHHLDLVVTNYNSNTFAVLLGNADGTFAAATTFDVANPDTIAVADLDGDGSLDVIVGLRSLSPSSIETFFNDGTGALTVGDTYTFGTSQPDGEYTASAIVTGDFEGDGHMDVVVSDTVFGDVILYPNPGNGMLGTGTTFNSLSGPSALTAADFNGDGYLDVAGTVYVNPPDGGTDTQSALLLLGYGHGGFSAPQVYADFLPSRITAGDFNGDGYPDVATGNSSWVSVLLSQCGTDASDAGDANDASDANTCTANEPADYANWHVSNTQAALVDNGDGTITDNATGLTWMKATAGEADGGTEIYTMSLAEAEAACPCPWRLPQRIELLSIVDYSRYYMALNPLFSAPAADTNIAWTATLDANSSLNWFVSLIEGEPYPAREQPAYGQVRCVRGTTAPPATRYTLETSDAGIAEVLDNGTGLIWKQDSEPGTYDWQGANARCVNPYRVPEVSELQTLVDSSRTNPAIDTTFFGDTESAIYTSATAVSYVYLEEYYWYVDFSVGSANYASLGSGGRVYNVRCVR